MEPRPEVARRIRQFQVAPGFRLRMKLRRTAVALAEAVRPATLCLVLLALVIPAAVFAQPPADEWLKKPVDDRTFKNYLDFFTYQKRMPFDARILGTEDQEGIKREHLSFQSTPGVRVLAHLYQPAATPQGGALILLHGGTARGKDSMAPLARNLVRSGWSVLAIDMLYFGERTTDLLTTFSFDERHERLYNNQSLYLAWVTQTVKDVSRAFDYLVDARRFDARRLGLMGVSRGAIAATIAAGVDQRLSPVVLGVGGHVDAGERGHLAAACPANFIGRISPRPLLMLNGLYDATMVKETSVEPLYALARQPKQILWSDGGHGPPSEQNQAAMLRWLRENLK